MPPKGKKRVVKRRPMPPQAGGSWAGDAWKKVKGSHIIRDVAGAAGGVFGGPIGGAAAYGLGTILGLGAPPKGRARVPRYTRTTTVPHGTRGVLKF